MKKYPLIALPLSTLLILTGCGGSGSGGDDNAQITTPAPVPPAGPTPPPPPPAPTVSVTAPATAIANVAFNVAWTSTDADSCSAQFTRTTTASGTASVTATTTGEQTYEVTCTGAGGQASDSRTVDVGPQATAEGLWQGTGTGNGGDRTIAGVITKEDAYWLTYSAPNTTGAVGFFAGIGSSQPDGTGTSGTFTSGSLREFNFEGVEAGGGSLSAGTYSKTGSDKTTFTFGGTTSASALSASYTFGGTQNYSIDNVTTGDLCSPDCATLTQTPNPPTFDDGGNRWTIVPNVNSPTGAPALSGTFRFQPYEIVADLTNIGFPVSLDLTYPARTLTISGGHPSWDAANRRLTVTEATFIETSDNFSCDDGGLGLCSIVPRPSVPTTGDVVITYIDTQLTQYNGVAHTYQLANADPANGGVSTGCIGQGGGDWCANGELNFSGTIPNAQPVSQTLTTTYNAAYETTPALADVAGTFAGSDGVGTTLNNNASLTLTATGQLNATVENGQCSVTGSVATHPSGGNVYDATLTFGSGCTYTGDFTGIATYDAAAGAITVTAVNANKDQGFLFTGHSGGPI